MQSGQHTCDDINLHIFCMFILSTIKIENIKKQFKNYFVIITWYWIHCNNCVEYIIFINFTSNPIFKCIILLLDSFHVINQNHTKPHFCLNPLLDFHLCDHFQNSLPFCLFFTSFVIKWFSTIWGHPYIPCFEKSSAIVFLIQFQH